MSLTGIRDAVFASLSRRFFYGWSVLGVAGLGIFASGPGQSHTFSVFVGPIGAELGVSSAAIASAYGLATLAAAFLLPQMGRLVDRHGPRFMTLLVVGALGLACMAFGAAANFLWLAVCFGLLRFFGQGSLMLNCANLVSQWFNRKRGFALGLMALGFAASMAVHPPLGQYLIDAVGWRAAWVVLGLLTWILMLPPVLLLVHDRPEDRGLAPDGDPPAGAGQDGSAAELNGLSLGEALRTPAFAILGITMCAIAMLVTTLHFYQVSIMEAQGLPPDIAASLFTVSAVVMVLAMPLVGRAFDRFPTRYVLVVAMLVTATSLIAITFADGLITALVYAVVFGCNNAFSMTMFGYIWPRYFGRRHLGSIQGTGQMIGVVGASLGPLPVGLAFDYLGSPVGTLQLLALYPAACALLLLFLKTPAGVTGQGRLE